jgi:hypothetical protein
MRLHPWVLRKIPNPPPGGAGISHEARPHSFQEGRLTVDGQLILWTHRGRNKRSTNARAGRGMRAAVALTTVDMETFFGQRTVDMNDEGPVGQILLA